LRRDTYYEKIVAVKALRLDPELKLVMDAAVPRRPDEALVQVVAAGICNTDLEIVKGYAAFRGTLGHEFVGRVVKSPDPALAGKRVVGEINAGCGLCAECESGDSRHCAERTVLGIKNRDGAFAEFLSLPVRNLIAVPNEISDDAAVFAEPLAAACNILEQVSIDAASNVAVVGDGKLAQLITLVISGTGCHLTIIGKHDEKLRLASRFGATSTLRASDLHGSSYEARFDVVIEATGSPSGLEASLKLVKPRGTVVLKSTHHGSSSLDASLIVVNEIRVVGSRCGRIRHAIDFLARHQVDLSDLVSERLLLEEGLRAFDVAAASNSMKVILQMW
jgi:threonine dehydrogenase-like Zn-dependent dehydrogenase